MNYRTADACGVGARVLKDTPADVSPQLSGYMLGNKPQQEVVTLVRVPYDDGAEDIAGLVVFDGVPLFAHSDSRLWTVDRGRAVPMKCGNQRNLDWMCRLLNPCFGALPEATHGMDIPLLSEHPGGRGDYSREDAEQVEELINVGNIPKYLASLMGLYAYYRQDRPFPTSLELSLKDEPPVVNRAVRISYVRRHTVGRNLLSLDPRTLQPGWLKVAIRGLTD